MAVVQRTVDKVMAGLFASEAGELLIGAAILALTAAVTGSARRVTLAQKHVTLSMGECGELVEALVERRLHTNLVSLASAHYVITSVTDRVVHGRMVAAQTGPTMLDGTGGGIILIRGDKLVLVALYESPTLVTQVLPDVERWGRELIAHGL